MKPLHSNTGPVGFAGYMDRIPFFVNVLTVHIGFLTGAWYADSLSLRPLIALLLGAFSYCILGLVVRRLTDISAERPSFLKASFFYLGGLVPVVNIFCWLYLSLLPGTLSAQEGRG